MASVAIASQRPVSLAQKIRQLAQQLVRATVDKRAVNEDRVPAQRRPLLTPEELSAYLGGIPLRTLDRWRSQRTGPLFIRVGRFVRYRPEDVESWLADRSRDADRWMTS